MLQSICRSPSRWFALGVVCDDYRSILEPTTWVIGPNASLVPTPNPAFVSIDAECNSSSVLNSTLRLRLLNDSWVSAVGSATEAGDAVGALILKGIYSAETGSAGWNSIVQKLLTPSMIERVDDAEVVIHVPPDERYAIYSPETLQLYVPAVALLSARMLVSFPPLEIVATDSDTEAIASGTLIEQGEESLLQAARS